MLRLSRPAARFFTRVLPLILLAAAPFASLGAQRLGPPPKRPKLAAADTNDARAYLDLGMRSVANNPSTAADAFYWAARIDPGLADALHGRRAALLLADEGLMKRVMTSNGRNRSKKELHLDSLQLRAIMLNPLLYRRLDLSVLQTYFRQDIMNGVPASAQPSQLEIDHEIDLILRQAGPYWRGWMAYARGDFKGALSGYADAMKGNKETADLRIERGRIFGMQAQPDSAIAEFQAALVELRKKDAKNVVVLYNSKAVVEQAIGMMMEQKNNPVAAREAYGRALQEDLAYWPAHFSLGMMAAGEKDTTTALSEFSLATDIAVDEPYVHAMVGSALVNLGRSREAIAPLKKAIELEPFHALPHIALGRIYESTNSNQEALAAYEGFLLRASRNDPQRAFAEGRVAALKGRLEQ